MQSFEIRHGTLLSSQPRILFSTILILDGYSLQLCCATYLWILCLLGPDWRVRMREPQGTRDAASALSATLGMRSLGHREPRGGRGFPQFLFVQNGVVRSLPILCIFFRTDSSSHNCSVGKTLCPARDLQHTNSRKHIC